MSVEGSIEDKLIVSGAAVDDELQMSGSAIDDKVKMPGAAGSAIDDKLQMSGAAIDDKLKMPGASGSAINDELQMSGGHTDGTAQGALAAQRARAKNQKRNERRKAAWQREHAQQLKEVRSSYRLCRLAPTDRRCTSTSEICAPHRRRRSR